MKKRRTLTVREVLAAGYKDRAPVGNLVGKRVLLQNKHPEIFGCGLVTNEDLEKVLAARDPNSPPPDTGLRITVFSSEHPDGYDGGLVTNEELEKMLTATPQRVPRPAELAHFRNHIASKKILDAAIERWTL